MDYTMQVYTTLVLGLLCPHVLSSPHNNTRAVHPDDASYYALYSSVDKRDSYERSGEPTETHSCGDVRAIPDDLREELAIPEFYQKYTEAYGLPIITSSLVPDSAITRACYTVRFLFADWYAVRRGYYKKKGRFGLIARREMITDIPEYSHLPEWWNTRARGLGATMQSRISIGAEENAECAGWGEDRWSHSDIVMHEYAHGMDALGLSMQNPDFDYGAVKDFASRLWTLFKDATVEKGLWEDSYIGSHKGEYFAQGMIYYFNDGGYGPKGIDTRDELKDYDPGLYELMQDVFYCNNEYIPRCEDKTQEKILKQRLRLNAPECKLEEGEDEEGEEGKEDKQCEDQNKKCKKLAKKGRCNKKKIQSMCPKSCKQC